MWLIIYLHLALIQSRFVLLDMLLCQAVYWKYHSEKVRSNRGITVFTNKFIIVNPSKLVSKTQDQTSELIKLLLLTPNTGWIKLESRFLGEIPTTSDIQIWYYSNGRRWRGTKEPLDKGEKTKCKRWLKTQYPKN